MFEFHGWAVVRVEERDEESIRQIGGREDQAIKRVRAAVNEIHDEFSCFEVRRTGNGQIMLVAHGLRNHRYEPVLELFRWLAGELPESYGLLYVHDDEHPVYGNEFRVGRLARGKFTEHDDSLLSPYVPTVEKPWEETGKE